jgi:hypothetical protein
VSFMEPEGPLPYSPEPVIGPYLEMDATSMCIVSHTYFYNIILNIILLSKHKPAKWFLPRRWSNKNVV